MHTQKGFQESGRISWLTNAGMTKALVRWLQCAGHCLRSSPCCQSCIRGACGGRGCQTRSRSVCEGPRMGMPALQREIGRQARFRTTATLSPMAKGCCADSW